MGRVPGPGKNILCNETLLLFQDLAGIFFFFFSTHHPEACFIHSKQNRVHWFTPLHSPAIFVCILRWFCKYRGRSVSKALTMWLFKLKKKKSVALLHTDTYKDPCFNTAYTHNKDQESTV